MFKKKEKLQLLKIFLFFFLGLIFITNNSVMAMNNSINEEISEITKKEENEEIKKIISLQKFCALHEMGHAVVAYELSQRHGTYLINLIKIELIQDNKNIVDGTTEFVFDKEDPFGNLFALSGFYGGLEAEKTIKIPIENFKNRGNHDEQDIERIVQYIIEKRWFLENFYSSTDSLETRKVKIKDIAQQKTQEIIKQYEKFLSPLADELLQKQNITKREFEDLLEKLINKKNNSPKNTQIKEINQSKYNIKNSKCNCFIL
ncbi:Conserved hypothetical protein [Candidatus Phytoplasma australiense]|uniref:Sequence-variable mosaic (SVM) signal sequence domain-containing protein n=1 Tax=Phytoplasma australiense TaxID=59748 RepID=B1V9M3_PHYAS|nr:Conserved hypothetical protein [Candidatus Phytoplasma australiense]